MRVILHIGLHKTGTTAVQTAWREAFPAGGGIWFPRVGYPPGHALIAWWLREAAGVPGWHPLTEVMQEASSRRVDCLLLSSEEFHSASPEQVERLKGVLRVHKVELQLTLTQPTHRWPSLWQEMVKHGWSAPQNKSVVSVDKPGVLGEARLEELVERWSIGEMTVCLVRQHPPEPRLAERVSDLMGVSLPARLRRDLPAANTSLGDVETRVLCEVNRLAPDTRGIGSTRGRAVVEALMASGPAGASRVVLDPEVVDHVAEVAALEKAALERLSESGRVRLDDRWGLLQEWDRMD